MTSTTPGWRLGRRDVEEGHAAARDAADRQHGIAACRADGCRRRSGACPVTFRTPSRRVSGWPMFEPCRRWAGAWVRLISGVMERSGNGGEGRGRQRRNALGRSRRGERQRAHDDPARELDLEGVVAGRLCVGERRLRGARGRRRRRAGGLRASSSAARARHGLAATPPSASRASRIVPPSIRKRRGGRDDGEGVGGALADLQIARMRRESRAPRPAAAARRSDRRARARFRARACRRAGDASASSATSRRPFVPSISTTASSATSGTQKSDGWVAMQASLQPSTACRRFSPSRASQPAPGSRLLQALAVS